MYPGILWLHSDFINADQSAVMIFVTGFAEQALFSQESLCFGVSELAK